MRALLVLAPVLLALPHDALAQRLAATVFLPGGTAPAAGAIVVATDSAGRELAHAVSRDDGRFELFVDSTATVSVRALRIGFGPTDVLTRRFRDGEVDSTRIVLGGEPVAFPRSVPRGATTCGGRGDGRAAVESLLEEARKVFLVAQSRAGRADSPTRSAAFQHRTAKNGEDTLYTLVRRAAGVAPETFAAVTTDELESRGFFVTIAGERTFHAPALPVLASDWFTRTHCFTLRKATPDELVLTFEPARERKGMVDVSGEYRFDRASGGLRAVSFTYVGLPAEERKSGAGGLIEFARMSNGSWLAEHWHQRFPLLGYRQSAGATTLIQSQMTLIDVIGHRTLGGRITAVTHDGKPLFQHDALPAAALRTPYGGLCPERLVTAAAAAARGTIVPSDSLAAGQIAVRATWKVLVVVDRTEMAEREQVRETITGDDGAWVLCDLPVDRDVEISWEIRGKAETRPVRFTEALAVLVVR
ncbi:MAG TPA: carboxypeptidase-like regulatory domain-containing protein [Gemmatimonadaceae bacterium]|nr:carboxypeptidase-like regulatory domain-containing protein [Gemmatimonadaceae bacterium]